MYRIIRVRLVCSFLCLTMALSVSSALGAAAPAPRTNILVREDPLVRMPGTQPGQVTLQDTTECYACHGSGNGPWTRPTPDLRGRTNYEEYNIFKGWQGSMMGNSARDPLMFASLTVAAQDSFYALGTPNAVDTCLRCHFPKGWLEGRTDQPGQLNASAMTAQDYDGVQCSFCHRMSDPFYKGTYSGVREGNSWSVYWDEQNSSLLASQYQSQTRATQTLQADMLISPTIKLFSGAPFFVGDNPFSMLYTENGSAQFFISPTAERRGSFADVFVNDPQPDHDTLYSRYHKGKFICDSCHDVSNPVMANLPQKNTKPGDKVVLATEKLPSFAFSHMQRTFSEFRLSAYNLPGGADGKGNFKPNTGPRNQPAPAGTWETDQPGNKITKCQDCHMCSRWSIGSNDPLGPVRPEGSLEHPNTWVPCHALTGGNVWIPSILATIAPDAPAPDPINMALLTGTAVDTLTMDVMQGSWTTLRPPTEPTRIYDALTLTATRNRGVLVNAANITDLKYLPATGALTFRVQNNSGHKLISGFPEGRRMFVNIKVYKGTALLREVNPYDATVGTLKGLPDSQSSPPLAANELYSDPLVYEVKLGSTITGEQKSFHFALATHRYKDNRIPPKGFNIAGAAARLSEPVWLGLSAPNYFTSAEYAGGYDELALIVPKGATSLSVNLYYQTTSREYMEFLRDEINGTGRITLPQTAYIVQSDPFFVKLKGWGDTIFNLWDHNKNLDGGKPFLMTHGTWIAP